MKPFLKALIAAPLILLSACSKDKLTPSLGLNSNLKMKNIKVAGFSGNAAAYIHGYATFSFVKPDDSNSAKLDTVVVVDTFNLPTTNGYDQNYNFNTPANSKYLNLDVSFYISNGLASAITFDNIEMDYNGKTYVNTGSQSAETTNGIYFDLPTISVTY